MLVARRRAMQGHDRASIGSGLSNSGLQVYSPYGSPYALPIPARQQSCAITTAPNVSYAASKSSGVMALANATTDFGLRFTGELRHGTIFRRALLSCRMMPGRQALSWCEAIAQPIDFKASTAASVVAKYYVPDTRSLNANA